MATNEKKVVVGAFTDFTQAERAVGELHRAGFKENQLGFIMRKNEEVANAKAQAQDATSSAEGSVPASAIGGGVIGGVLAGLAAITVPAVGALWVAGILAGVLGGASVGSTVGWIAGALVDLGMPDAQAHYFEEELHRGRILVVVKPGPGQAEEASDILLRNAGYVQGTGSAPVTNPLTGKPTGETA